jgi:hypothetical protein
MGEKRNLLAGTTSSRLSDTVTYVISVALAAGCIIFAGYKVIALQRMENPPADLGLNFPPPKRKIITDDSILVDPASTQATSPLLQESGDPRPLQPYTSQAPVESYRLLTVIDDVAFVEIKTYRGKDILPLTAGAQLPGAGPVERIERVGGRWSLAAGDLNLTAARR